MSLKPLTYGTLPCEDEFREAFPKPGDPDSAFGDGHFHFENDSRVGTCELTCSELWRELKQARAEWQGFTGKAGQWVASEAESDAAGQWCSNVLSVLGWEWI